MSMNIYRYKRVTDDIVESGSEDLGFVYEQLTHSTYIVDSWWTEAFFFFFLTSLRPVYFMKNWPISEN